MKRCPRNALVQQQQQQQQKRTSQFEAETSFLGGIFRSASSPSNWFSQQQRQQPSRPASKVLPPTQQPPAESQMSEAALRVRQSPALSLFNQLAGLVVQLEQSRDFFLDWPQLVCQRIRRSGQAANGGASDLGNATNSGAGECWNGRDFSGYSKALAPFGQPIRSDHPELAVSTTQPISEFILKLVARFKDAQTQLARSARSPITPFDLMALTAKLTASGTSGVKTSGINQRPEAAAQVSQDSDSLGGDADGGQLANSATSDQQQKLLADQLTAMAVNPGAAQPEDLSSMDGSIGGGSNGEQADESGNLDELSEDEDGDESDGGDEDEDDNLHELVPNCPQGDDNCEHPLDTPHSTESTESSVSGDFAPGSAGGSPTLDFTSPNLAYPPRQPPSSSSSSSATLGGELFSNFVTVPQQYTPAAPESNPALVYPNNGQQTDATPQDQSPMDFGQYTSAPASSSACSIVGGGGGGGGAQWQLGGLKLGWPYAASHLLLLAASFLFSLCCCRRQQTPAPA